VRPVPVRDRSIAGESTRTSHATPHIQVAIIIDEKMREFADDPCDDIAVLAAMRPYMPRFKELMDTASTDELLTILQRYPGLRQFARVLERVAAGIN
jgi:hypothetical protein